MGRATSNHAATMCGAIHIVNGWRCVRQRGHGGDNIPARIYYQNPSAYGDWHGSVIGPRFVWWPPHEGRQP